MAITEPRVEVEQITLRELLDFAKRLTVGSVVFLVGFIAAVFGVGVWMGRVSPLPPPDAGPDPVDQHTPQVAVPFSPPQPAGSPASTTRRAENAFDVHLPARPPDWGQDVLSTTTIEVKEGDVVTLAASGRWNVGLGSVSPDGTEDWCECLLAERVGAGSRGRVGALVGRIGRDGAPFLVGSGQTITALQSGVLFLGANDNLGPCDGVSRGSCYRDNTGSIAVRVEIKRS